MVSSPGRDKQLAQFRASAAQLFIHGFPLLLADAIRRSHPMAHAQLYLLGPNGAALAPGLEGEDSRVVIASAWIDLADQPVILRLPATHGRHLVLTLFDSSGRPFGSAGSRTGHDGGADIAVVGPNWRGELPGGLTARRAPSDSAWVVSRLYAHSGIDYRATAAIAKRQCVAHLAPDNSGSNATLPSLAPPSPPTARQVAGLTPELLLHRLQAIIDRAPRIEAAPIRALLAELTAPLDPSEDVHWRDAVTETLTKGFADGLESIRTTAAQAGHDTTDSWWPAPSNAGAWPATATERAARAYADMGAPEREDVLAFSCDQDRLREPLSGACSYVIHFPRTGLPPAEAFWRLIAVPATPAGGRHGLGDHNDLLLNRDGSLDILIQVSPPEPGLIRNWLPAPGGQFSLSMRLHWPRTPALTGSWRMPPVERTDSGLTATDPGRRKARPPNPGRSDPTQQQRESFLIWRSA